MLLRRITEHIKAQNWTAVALDFVIVVVGVFMGIQLGNWNGERAERQRETGYLERLRSDVEFNIVLYEQDTSYRSSVRALGLRALSIARGETKARDNWDVVLSFFQAGQSGGNLVSSPTFSELLSAGDLQIISNETLRQILSVYFTPGSEALILDELPVYREQIRSIIPIGLQDYIWEHCHATNAERVQTIVDCEAPPIPINPELVDRLLADEELQGQLRYWMSTQRVALSIYRDRIALSEQARDAITMELEKH